MADQRLRRLSTGTDGLASLLRRASLTVSGGVLVAATALGWLAARWLGSRTLFLMVYAWALTMVVAWVVSRRTLAVRIDRSLVPSRMREGQSIPVELTIAADKRLSTVVIEERLPPELGRSLPVPVGSMAPGTEREHRYTLNPSRRGVYEIGPVVGTWSDPFGLTIHEQQLAEPIQVIVHPATEPVHDRVLTRMWEDPPIRPPVSKPWPVGFEFYGMRDYVPGDDLRRVVWSAVAKTGRMLVRESEQGITDRVTIVLDCDRSFHSPGEPSATFETAVRVAASLGAHHLDDGFAVSYLTNDGTGLPTLRGGVNATYTLLDELARVERGSVPLSTVGARLLSEARRGTHLLLVTPHLDKDFAATLRLALDRGISATVVFVVWEESDPQAVSRAASLGCIVVQVEAGESLDSVFAHQVGGGMRR